MASVGGGGGGGSVEIGEVNEGFLFIVWTRDVSR